MTLPQKITKRLFDMVFSFCGLCILWPFGLLIAIVVKMSSRGPVFYSQKRIGQYGREFYCYKFRSMFVDSDKYGSVTTGIDKRITSVGRFMRKYKLDEFPQLWNVFIGKMSFVGPRPDVPGYADQLQGDERLILKLRPGITGPASIYFRDEEQLLAKVEDPLMYNDKILWPQKVRINIQYYKNWSIWKDIGYIIITIVPAINRFLKLIPEKI